MYADTFGYLDPAESELWRNGAVLKSDPNNSGWHRFPMAPFSHRFPAKDGALARSAREALKAIAARTR